ncbi:two-component system, chemotaxis family, response regulator CheY [Lachnospiraceae bacterium RM5]|nr:two-component system, chemotaxis family, response regulator CheY [Lachnospiraceae bacterium RM5]
MDIKDIKILICDDSILSRKKLRDYISSLGCENIYDAEDGEDAIAQYTNLNPDLVFMDIVMPRKDGIEALRAILEMDEEAFIVMASSVGTQSYLKDAIKAGAKDFLQKPLDSEQVKQLIDNFCKGGY